MAGEDAIVIFGAGGQGREVLEIFTLSGQTRVIGFIDEDPGLEGTRILGVPVLGGLSWLERQQRPIRCICALGDNQTRKKAVQKLSGLVCWINAIHPTAFVSPSARLGKGVIIGPGALVNTTVNIGNHVIVNAGVSVSHDCIIEDYCNLNPRSTLAGTVNVKEGAFIGMGAVVIQNLTVGPWSLVAAGSVVIRDIPGHSRVAGVPTRHLK